MKGMLDSATPEQIEKMMNTMSKFSTPITYVMKFIAFVTKYKYFVMAGFGYLVYRWWFGEN